MIELRHPSFSNAPAQPTFDVDEEIQNSVVYFFRRDLRDRSNNLIISRGKREKNEERKREKRKKKKKRVFFLTVCLLFSWVKI